MQVPRDRPIPHPLAPGGVSSDPYCPHREKENFLLEQLIFFGFQPLLGDPYQLLQNQSKIRAENQDVVQVDQALRPDDPSQHPPHQPVKDGWGRCQSKGHHFEFVQASLGDERSLFPILWPSSRPVSSRWPDPNCRRTKRLPRCSDCPRYGEAYTRPL